MNLHILICGGWVDNNMNITYNMNTTGVVLVLCISCSLSVAGSFFGGFINGTEPHFLKVIEADKAKEIYSLAVKLREKHKNELSKFSNPGPGGSDLDEDEYDEYKKITDKLKEETRDSFFCKKAIAFDIKGSKKVRDNYQTNVFTLDGTKRKKDIYEKYIGSNDVEESERMPIELLFQICMNSNT